MGILNITPDSFSDGSRFLDPKLAVERALEMVDEGADIIDIGGESTRPGAPMVDSGEEIRRIVPVISAAAERIACPISVDTRKSLVAREAIAAGAEIINDVSGFTFDPAIAGLAAKSGTAVVLMHTRGTPDIMQQDTCYDNLIGEVVHGLRKCVQNAVNAGIERNRIAIDPGIGFGKDVAGNLMLLRHLQEFNCLGLPLMVGTSRKSFIGKLIGKQPDELVYGTAATVALAVANGASILRVHDVRAMREVVTMAHAIMRGC